MAQVLTLATGEHGKEFLKAVSELAKLGELRDDLKMGILQFSPEALSITVGEGVAGLSILARGCEIFVCSEPGSAKITMVPFLDALQSTNQESRGLWIIIDIGENLVLGEASTPASLLVFWSGEGDEAQPEQTASYHLSIQHPTHEHEDLHQMSHDEVRHDAAVGFTRSGIEELYYRETCYRGDQEKNSKIRNDLVRITVSRSGKLTLKEGDDECCFQAGGNLFRAVWECGEEDITEVTGAYKVDWLAKHIRSALTLCLREFWVHLSRCPPHLAGRLLLPAVVTWPFCSFITVYFAFETETFSAH